jgi:general secretion pathway protein K
MESLLRDTRGVALILTILVVSLIVALTLEFNRTMRDQVVSAGNTGHGLKALYNAKSGISIGLAVLKEDNQDVDSVQDDWAELPSRLLSIEDLSGKIQINKLVKNEGEEQKYDKEQREVLTRFLKLDEFGLDDEEAEDIVAAVKDWIDTDDDTTTSDEAEGAEAYYYEPMGYHCPNGPLDSPEELRLVKGMTPEDMPYERFSDIVKHISVFGDGKININTADLRVLASLHEDMIDLDNGMVDGMVEYRENADDPDNDLESPTWYKQAGVPNDITIDQKIIKTNTSHFQITSTGQFGDITRQVVAVVKRSKDEDKEEKFQTLSWKLE